MPDTNPSPSPFGDPNWVPRSRFNAVSRKLKESTEALAAKDKEIAAHKATIAERDAMIAKGVEDSKKALADKDAAHAQAIETAKLEALGYENADWDIIRAGHAKLPAEGRKPLAEMAKTWLEKPDEAPAFVRGYLPTKGGDQKKQPGKPPNSGKAKVEKSGDAPWTPESIASLSREDYAKHKDSILEYYNSLE